MVCEPENTSGSKKIVWKFHCDQTLRLKVISEKQCYAAMKYIVVTCVLDCYDNLSQS